MKRWRGPITAGLIITAVLAVVLVSAYSKREKEQQQHYQNEETRVTVSNIAGAAVELFQAGSTMEDAKPVRPAGSTFWLRRGNYFLRIQQGPRTSFYPVSIVGYRAGPEKDGSLIVTIRPYPEEQPPMLLPLQEFAFIPSGYFLLGDRVNPQDPHYIWLGAYFIEKFEVTNAEFRQFLNDPAGYTDESNWTEEGKRWRSTHPSRVTALLKPEDTEYRRFGLEDHPVVEVKWYEANAYCRWLTRKLGSGIWEFSLPSEAEWEKAGRGPDSFDYGLGLTLSDEAVRLYNWRKNPDARITVETIGASKREYTANRYGIYHMSGNASEWTQSIDRPYNREHPYVEEDRNRDDTAGQRVVRGGSWYTASIALLNLAYRDTFSPEQSTNERGFRIVARRMPITTSEKPQKN
ncbi:MAG TPA: SUMF1/EgtB/PvdO family nonheme iron enzyme [Acidobacteriota bacterium]|nr:SUMF1/EgtB/PvdO family nonheme iron enzyme [Acidobacteriota bacterium]